MMSQPANSVKSTTQHSFTRRGFLKAAVSTTAWAAPYLITTTALGSAPIPPASERIAVGHIGVGGQGGGLLTHFMGLSDCQCVAVCDPFRERREGWARKVEGYYAEQRSRAAYSGCVAYLDFRDLLARSDVDAVVIATPDHWHVPIALEASRAGKDMYVEKPLGLSIEQDRILRASINRYGNVFQYGTQQRSQSHLRFACELVRNGRVGPIHTIEVVAPSGSSGGKTKRMPIPDGFDYDRWLGPAPWKPYTEDRCIGVGRWHIYDYALGFIAGWGAHPLDIAQWGNNSDDTSPVEYEGRGVIPTSGLFDTVTSWEVHCRYASGVKMLFRDGPDATKFIGPDGWVNVGREFIDAHPKSLLRSRLGPHDIRLHASGDQKQDFLDAVKTRRPTVNPIESAVRSDAISHLSDIAIRLGRKIYWDPVKEDIIGDESAARMLTRPMRSPWRL